MTSSVGMRFEVGGGRAEREGDLGVWVWVWVCG